MKDKRYIESKSETNKKKWKEICIELIQELKRYGRHIE